MSAKAEVLDLAILGQLQSPAHGYELRKRLATTLGRLRAWSYGSLYPALRRLTEAGLITSTDDPTGKRAKIVYSLTKAGRVHLNTALAGAGPDAWNDDAFDVHFANFSSTDTATRLRILEGRRSRMVERLAALRAAVIEATERMDKYAAELSRHGLAQAEADIAWIERVIDTERGTAGPYPYYTGPPTRATESPSPPPGPRATHQTTNHGHPATPPKEN
ncbi:PadR family transcriptional regulator [Buchananella hordeovulneris]|uniref:Transcription regulator PadR N-terminal domain-containing protein n=2 Tax=Buchananella hordeovulneris TaxID=52770 RepID=A0A1Q5PTD5_9ACTO|nr:PadR family transcriptional regulator [Buchananella hordeovulneris]OKL50786.1 hypothetical protein BSZ40_10885 [Buchananella hordeovulneris]RRD43464.1 PadR family transcriptional regulator [Buchananella hordeovulneris]